MNTRFLIPASLALAIHGGLFFGFPDSPRVAVAAPDDKPIIIVCDLHLMPDEPVKLDLISDEPTVKKGEPIDVPRGDERPPIEIKTDDFIITPPPITPVKTGDLKRFAESGLEGGLIGGADIGKNILPATHLDSPPRARFQAAPLYPFEEKKNGIPGEVMVEFEVDESGVVHNARVTRSSSRAFEEPTLRAVAKWRFEPGKRHGKVVGFRMTVPVIFSLND